MVRKQVSREINFTTVFEERLVFCLFVQLAMLVLLPVTVLCSLLHT